MADIRATDDVLKHSAESLSYTFNCTELLGTQTIVSVGSVVDQTTHDTSVIAFGTAAVNTAAVVVDGVTIAIGKAVQVTIAGGTAAANHIITVTFTTSSGDVRVTGGTLQVRDS